MAKQRRPLPKPTKASSPSSLRPKRPMSVDADAPASGQTRAPSSGPPQRSTYVEAVAIYERGEALKSHCEGLLKAAEARIEKITLKNGKPVGTEPLDP